MDARSAYSSKDSYTFVDVREPMEWEAGHIEGALHIPLSELPVRYAEIGTDLPVVTVCSVGQRSLYAAQFLSQAGFEAHNMEGGLFAWEAEQFPLVGAQGGPGRVAG